MSSISSSDHWSYPTMIHILNSLLVDKVSHILHWLLTLVTLCSSPAGSTSTLPSHCVTWPSLRTLAQLFTAQPPGPSLTTLLTHPTCPARHADTCTTHRITGSTVLTGARLLTSCSPATWLTGPVTPLTRPPWLAQACTRYCITFSTNTARAHESAPVTVVV